MCPRECPIIEEVCGRPTTPDPYTLHTYSYANPYKYPPIIILSKSHTDFYIHPLCTPPIRKPYTESRKYIYIPHTFHGHPMKTYKHTPAMLSHSCTSCSPYTHCLHPQTHPTQPPHPYTLFCIHFYHRITA